jgi:hypothetical protein
MKITPLFAVLLAVAPAVAAGRGGSRGSSARGTKLTLSRPMSGRSSFAFGSFARTRFAARSTFAPSGFRSSSFSAPARASHFSSAASPAAGSRAASSPDSIPLTGGSTAPNGNWGTPLVGSMNNSTAIGGPNGLGTQTVAGGNIQQNPGTAVNAGRAAGITWAAPDASPGGAAAGGTGVTTNGPAPGH